MIGRAIDGFHPLFLVVLLAAVLIIFGPGRLPELGSALGRSLRELRNAGEGRGGEEEDPRDS